MINKENREVLLHVMIRVKDIQKSLDFYSKLFDMPEDENMFLFIVWNEISTVPSFS